MAKITWNDVTSYLDTTYRTDRRGDMVGITFQDTATDRSQLVLVDHEQQPDRLVIEIVSRVGVIATSLLPKALEVVGKKYFVALEKMGDYYYVRVTVNMNYAPLSEISNMVKHVCSTADSLEKDFVGGDAN